MRDLLAFADTAVAPSASESTTVTRTAQIDRRTGETDVSLTLGLSGTGAGTRSTGVGFLDHMLDLLARHGGLDLEASVKGDLQTGSHHTVEDTGIVLGQALDRALGERRGIARYGHAVIPMDEARAACAIDVSGRPYCACEGFERLPAGDIAGFEHEAAEEFFRAVASAARIASWSLVITERAPTCSSAFSTERRLPIP